MPRVETLSVYLIKDTVLSAADAVKEAGVYREHVVQAGETAGTLYVLDTDDRQPDWVRLLAPVTNPPLDERSRASGGVLILSAAGRWFALTFGHGRHLLDPDAYDRRFGLRVVLNAVDPDRLRGAQARTFNDYALHTQRQLSRLATIDALDLDVQQDLLTSLGGALADPDLGVRADGREAVRLTAELDAHDLAPKCAELLAQSERTDYLQTFPWIDNIEEIVDSAEIERLDSIAFQALGQRLFDRFDLYPPELVPDEVVEYRLWPAHGGQVVFEPDRDLLRLPLRAPMGAAGARAAVARYRLVARDANDQEVKRWSFLDCLHYEHRQANGSVVVLDGGRWYRIKAEVADDVEQFVQTLGPSSLALPDARRKETEPAYNSRVGRDRDDLVSLDTKLIRLAGQSGVEPCDLFSRDRHFVHVKRRKGGSGPLSHLFAQATVAGELFLTEQQFGDELRTLLDAEQPGSGQLIGTPVHARDYKVVLALMTKPGTGYPARELPFFSKLNLRLAVRRLQAMGYSVYVDEIPIPLPTPPRGARTRAPAQRPAPAPRPARR